MEQRKTPRLANRLLAWFCKPEVLEFIQGDLEEQFERSGQAGWKRNLQYWFQVVNMIRPFAIKKWKIFHNNFTTLLRFNFLVTFRSIRKNTFFTTLNVVGLGIGLFSCLLILASVSEQFSYDKFHSDFENTYRVTHSIKDLDNSLEKIATFSRVGEELALNYPSVKDVCRVFPLKGNVVVEKGETRFLEQKMLGVDASFFNLFQFTFLHGSPQIALQEPRSIVITERIFNKFFKEDQNPIGEEIVIDGAFGFWSPEGYQDRLTYKVMGVISDLPSNTHLDFEYLISLNIYSDLERELNNWGESFYTYFKVDDPANVGTILSGLPAIVEKYRPNQNVSLGIQKMQSIHLASNRVGELKSNGSEKSVWLLVGVAFILLAIAGTNYINFATAKAISRQKEIGIRKVFWAKPNQLFMQLMTEAFVMNALSLGFALLLIPILNPLTSDLMGFNLIDQVLGTQFLTICLVLFLLATLLSGLYPAFYISKLSISGVIQGSMGSNASKGNVRKLLVGFQFAMSLLVIGFSAILFSQMSYINKKDLGMNIDRTIVANGPSVGVDNDSIFNSGMSYFKEEALKLSNISKVTLANFIPGKAIRGEANGYVRRSGTPESEANSYYFSQIDYQFFPTMEIPVVAGRSFDSTMGSDHMSIVINKEAAFQLGFRTPQEAIGQKIIYRRGSTPTIIGVVDNFHQYSLKRDFQPIIFEVRDAPDKYCYLKIVARDDLSQLIKLQEIWERTFPGNPFNFFFLENTYAKQYQEEDRFMKAFGMFSILAVFVAALGMLGLAFFIAKSSEKEIGIRKTLGANFFRINMIVVKRLGLYVVLACVVSVPFVYFVGENWLNTYAFRIDIAWWMLAAPVGILIFTAIAVVTSQSLKAFRLNPVQSLRSE